MKKQTEAKLFEEMIKRMLKKDSNKIIKELKEICPETYEFLKKPN